MSKVKVRIVNKSKHALPEYSTPHSAGMDIRAKLDNPLILKPMQRALIPTGMFIELPPGFEAQIRPRSGLALEKGISSINDPGTIDADYRGEISILLINFSHDNYTVNDGDRICQMIISRHATVEWDEVDILGESERGDGGFGHTGKE